MSLPKKNYWKVPNRPNGRISIFPEHRADFSNLEDLYEVFAGPHEVSVISGPHSGDSQFPGACVMVTSDGTNLVYKFIKRDAESYLLKVYPKSHDAEPAEQSVQPLETGEPPPSNSAGV